MQTASVVIDALARAPDVIIPLVREVPPAIRKRRPAPGRWSAHEHACHLAHVHALFFARLAGTGGDWGAAFRVSLWVTVGFVVIALVVAGYDVVRQSEQVRRSIQHGMDTLARRRAFPVFG